MNMYTKIVDNGVNVAALLSAREALFWVNSDVLLPFSNRLFVDSVFTYSNWDEVDTRLGAALLHWASPLLSAKDRLS